MRLAELCDIQAGYSARERLEQSPRGTLVVQLRDLADGHLDSRSLTRVDLPDSVERYLVRPGDVLFRSKGDRNTAAAVDDGLAEPAVAVLPLMILRPRVAAVTPAYLAWAINRPAAQRHFDATARGTKLRMVPRASLDELDIAVPPLATQQAVVAVADLAGRERDLATRAADLRLQLAGLTLDRRIDWTDATTGAKGRAP